MTKPNSKGFTLIEMVVVLGIFAVVSAVVLFNYDKFRSNTVLVNMAYEVALSIREAQIYGVSVRSSNSQSESFEKPYGIYIPDTETNQYVLFADDGDGQYDGTSCTDYGDDACIAPYALLGTNKFTNVQVESGETCDFADGGLHIVFKRPNPEPYLQGDTDISRAQITISSGTESRYVIVANNGQILVSNISICP